MENEEYLYKYLNIDSLTLILENKKIRLNPITSMDDLQEEMCQDLKSYGQYCFVSSWTSQEREIIPMWKMYCSKGQGVRIKLPKNPFKIYKINLKNKLPFSTEGNEFNSFLPIEDYLNNRYTPLFVDPNELLIQMEYGEDEEKLNPKIIQYIDGHYYIIVNYLGRYKNQYWSFQEEWRYLIWFFPFSLRNLVENLNNSDEFKSILEKGFLSQEELPMPYYDLVIRDEALNEMEIMLSPDISDGNRQIVKNLKEKYIPSAKVVESSLSGLIK